MIADQCAEALWKLKQSLPQAPILIFLDFTKAFVVDMDANNDRIDAVFWQEDDGRETFVTYASHVLSKTERRYCDTRAAGCCEMPLAFLHAPPRTPPHSMYRSWIPNLATQIQEPREQVS